MNLSRLSIRKPAARRTTLVAIAGLLWTLVGIGLVSVAGYWLYHEPLARGVLLAVIGIAAGLLLFRPLFTKLVAVNLDRIHAIAPAQDEVCVFAFQNVRSYLMIFVMMAMGYALRHSPLPKAFLGAGYLAIGVALIGASLHYYRRLRR